MLKKLQQPIRIVNMANGLIHSNLILMVQSRNWIYYLGFFSRKNLQLFNKSTKNGQNTQKNVFVCEWITFPLSFCTIRIPKRLLLLWLQFIWYLRITFLAIWYATFGLSTVWINKGYKWLRTHPQNLQQNNSILNLLI